MAVWRALKSLYVQVLIGIALGILVGWLWPAFGAALKPLGDAFVKLIKMAVAPVIFCTVAGGIARMWKRAAGGYMHAIHAGIDQPLAYLNRLLDDIPWFLVFQSQQRVVVIDAVDLHLQMKIRSDLAADGAHDFQRETRSVLDRAAVSSVRSLIPELKNCVIR